jgi:hypothetical protein
MECQRIPVDAAAGPQSWKSALGHPLDPVIIMIHGSSRVCVGVVFEA